MITPAREWEQPTSGVLPDGTFHAYGDFYRLGSSWTTEECEALLSAAADHCLISEAAGLLHRSRGGVSSRARILMPPDTPRAGTWWTTLCTYLEEHPDHDWRAALQAHGHLVFDHATLNAAEQMTSRNPADLATLEARTGWPTEVARRFLSRHGRPAPATPPPPGPSLRARNFLDTTTHLPTRAHPTAAGLDLRYAGATPVALSPNRPVALPTGVAFAVPEGFVGLLCVHPDLTAQGVTMTNSPGLVEHGDATEVRVHLMAAGAGAQYTVQPCEPIAQLVLTIVVTPAIELVDNVAAEDAAGGVGEGVARA